MADIVLHKGDDGKLCGLTPSDNKRWATFCAFVPVMRPGETIKVSFKIPRSPGFHRRHFKILAELFNAQDQFDDTERFREWVQVGAGFCDLLPGPKGKAVAIPKSIAWDALDNADFAEHHAAVIAFARSAHFTRFLWPHLSDIEGDTMVNSILDGFG